MNQRWPRRDCAPHWMTNQTDSIMIKDRIIVVIAVF